MATASSIRLLYYPNDYSIERGIIDARHLWSLLVSQKIPRFQLHSGQFGVLGYILLRSRRFMRWRHVNHATKHGLWMLRQLQLVDKPSIHV